MDGAISAETAPIKEPAKVQEEAKEDTREEAQEVKDMEEVAKEGTEGTKEGGARTAKEDGTPHERVTKGIKEEAKEVRRSQRIPRRR